MRIRMALLFLLVISPPALAGTYDDAASAAMAKNWTQARELAAKATAEDPGDAKAWFLLGIMARRLDDPAGAARAFRKAQALAPDTAYGKSAAESAPLLTRRADELDQRRFGRDSSAFFLEYSPILNSTSANQLGAATPYGIAGGFKFGSVLVGVLYGSAAGVKSILAPAEGSALKGPPSYTRISGSGTLLKREIFIKPEISLVKPYEGLGPFALELPLFFGGVENTFSLNGMNYGNLGYDMAAGLDLSLYTKSAVALTLSGLYHFGIPFWDIRHDSNTLGIQNTQGDVISGSNTGFEVNLGFRFLFGSKLSEEF